MNHKEAQQILKDAGYPIPVDGKWGRWSKRALSDTCRAWAFTKDQVGFKRPKIGGKLTPDRIRMLREIKRNGGRCSTHFKYVEFRCKGTTRGLFRPEDNWIKVSKKLVIKLEEHRRRFSGPINIVSAGRSERYNKAAGGASLSEHRYGWKWYIPRRVCKAVDINPKDHRDRVIASGIWGGVGWNTSTGNVSHVDHGRKRDWFYVR